MFLEEKFICLVFVIVVVYNMIVELVELIIKCKVSKIF